MVDETFLAEIIKLVFQMKSTVAVDDDQRAVHCDEESGEVCDLLCSCLFSAFEDMGET
jgi:hypothetical protein